MFDLLKSIEKRSKVRKINKRHKKISNESYKLLIFFPK